MDPLLLDSLAYPLAGWRYLLSPAYRRRTRERWANDSGLHVMQDVVGGATGVALTILLPLLAWWQLAAPG